MIKVVNAHKTIVEWNVSEPFSQPPCSKELVHSASSMTGLFSGLLSFTQKKPHGLQKQEIIKIFDFRLRLKSQYKYIYCG